MDVKRIVSIVAVLFLSISSIALAHSGGTDSSGGHHDYNNVSGLGSYHYHHGYQAHLHTGGVCPYNNNSSSTVQKSYSNFESLPEQAARLAHAFNYVDGEKYKKLVRQNKKLKVKNQELEKDMKFFKRWLMACIVFATILSWYLYYRGQSKFEEGYAKGKSEADKIICTSTSGNKKYIYCRVSFGNDYTYYYRTNDETIKKGSIVIVPAGPKDKPTEATVVSANSYPVDKVPFPLEKTKMIISKVK